MCAARRKCQADCARAWGRSQDGQTLAQAWRLAAAAPSTAPRPIDPFVKFIEQRGSEVGWNGVVLYRELSGLGFSGSYQQVQRFLKPYRAQRKWSELAAAKLSTSRS